jgi:hypothetical protein
MDSWEREVQEIIFLQSHRRSLQYLCLAASLLTGQDVKNVTNNHPRKIDLARESLSLEILFDRTPVARLASPARFAPQSFFKSEQGSLVDPLVTRDEIVSEWKEAIRQGPSDHQDPDGTRRIWLNKQMSIWGSWTSMGSHRIPMAKLRMMTTILIKLKAYTHHGI